MGKDLKGKELGDGLSQRKDGRYLARFTNRFGKREEYKSSDLTKVKEWLVKNKAKDELSQNTKNENLILDDWFEKWLTIHKYKVIRENSKVGYITHYKKHISPYMGKCKLTEITSTQIKSRINDMEKAGYGYEMQNRTKIILLDMFQKAMEDEFVYKNPARSVKVLRDEEIEPRVLTEEEQVIFMDCIKGTFYDNLSTLMVNTGIRPGEAYALEESDIDFENHEISITKTLIYAKWENDDKKTFRFGPPKTKTSERRVPLNRTAELALKKQIMQKHVMSERYHTGTKTRKIPEEFKNLLFTTRFNTPINTQIFNDAIAKIVDEINLTKDTLEEFEIFSPHCFRHTFATRCIEAGMKPKTLQKILGHATLQMTMDLYTHVLQKHKESEIALLECKMNELYKMGDEFIEKQYSSLKEKQNKIVRLEVG